MSYKTSIKEFGLVPGTERDVYVIWTDSINNVDHYEVSWSYLLKDIIYWWPSNEDGAYDEAPRRATRLQYTAPTNAVAVRVTIRPVALTHKVNGVDTPYWHGEWTTDRIYYFENNPPVTPSAPTVNIDKYTLTAKLENLDVNATHIQFQVYKNDSELWKISRAAIKTTSATFSCTVEAGAEYKVRCRAWRDELSSEWSPFSSNIGTMPAAPAAITSIKATSSTSVYLEWKSVSNADSYEIEFATKKDYLGTPDKSESVSGIEIAHHEKIGLETGSEYFFRVRAVNENGESAWSPIVSIVIGKAPSAPTTWSSTTTATVGGPLTLYWTHNAEDQSRQTYAEIEFKMGNAEPFIKRLDDTANDDDEDEEDVMRYSVDTSMYTEGTKILWRVRTAGVTKEYGDWSIQRTVDVYAPATLRLNVTDVDGNAIDTVTRLPLYISCVAGPGTQTPLGYHLTITANEKYQTTDNTGTPKIVSRGETVYSKNFDISTNLNVTISAGDINLDNNISYTVHGTVSMDSGLNAEDSRDITVAWADDMYNLDAEIGIDKETYSAYIKPVCRNSSGGLVPNVTLSVYRRNFDGKFVEIASGLENSNDVFVTDPHPSLDYARYRIVAISKTTGAVSYYDVPGYPVLCKSAILQWAETWTDFNTIEGELKVEPTWAGSMLMLHYNIDVSEQTDPDVVLVEYIGREHPVDYYGTQLGQTASWSTVIPKSDKDTLYALRRLSIWMGNVYVREPSGTGYWATIKVSYNQEHKNVTIPVTIDITRVEGGV